MNSYLLHYSAERNGRVGVSDLEEALEREVPIEYEASAEFVSSDRKVVLLAYDVGSSLYPEGSYLYQDGDSFTLFHGHVWRLNETERPERIAEVVHRYLIRTSGRELLNAFAGEFTVLQYEGATGTLQIMSDSLGLRPCYFIRSAEGLIVSNRLLAIENLAPAGTVTLDLQTLSYHATRGFLPPGRTIFKEVRELRHGSRLSFSHTGVMGIEQGQEVFFSPARSRDRVVSESEWDEAMEDIGVNLRNIAGCENIYPQLGLSGGKDSRLILAAALREGVADKMFIYTLGADSHPDVVVAKEITKHFGLPHVIRRPRLAAPSAMIELFEQKMPIHIWHSEGMLNLFDLHCRLTCGGEPVFNGLNGENLRSVWDLPDHQGGTTEGANDRASVLAVLDARAPHNLSGMVRGEIVREHSRERLKWIDRQLASGTAAKDLPSLYRSLFISLRRNSVISKVRGYWHPYINVLGGRRLFRVAFGIGASERRLERVHYELMKRCDPWLVKHRFAVQSWNRRVYEYGTPPRGAELPGGEGGRRLESLDWRRRINNDRKFKKALEEYLMDMAPTSGLWEVIDREGLEDFFARPSHGHMERFHFFGVLTLAMVLDRRLSKQRMAKRAR